MSTIAALIERLYRTYLYPPDHRPAQCFLDGPITSSATTITLKNFVIPEDEYLLTVGSIIEIGSELIQVTGYNTLTTEISSCHRGVMGTTAAAHDDEATVTLAPPFPRLTVFEAISDNIITLYPKLHQVTTTEVVAVSAGVAALGDPLAVEVIEAHTPDGQGIDARIVDFHWDTGSRSVITNVGTGDVWVKYRKRFAAPTDEATTLASLGVEERWTNIVMAGVCADLFAGRDLPASITDFVAKAIEAEVLPVGSRASLSQRLAAYRTYLLENARKEMRAEYRAATHMRGATQVRVRSPFG